MLNQQRESLINFAEEFCRKNVSITKAKNADYTGGKAIYANFDRSMQYDIDPADGFVTRMLDKLTRIETYLSGKALQVKDESGMDTLHDLANYAMLWDGWLPPQITNLGFHAETFYKDVLELIPTLGSTGTFLIEISLSNAIKMHRQGSRRQAHHSLTLIAAYSILIAYECKKTND